ncbi:YbfB/YjiJ family MFS transporter (plasmid) [Pantoea sp. C3]|uniref:YbfB/YjiJ family MFS transporter n=1 Tax=Pantoea phytostimulans TaxID=2769024 RepID=UPI0038F6703A
MLIFLPKSFETKRCLATMMFRQVVGVASIIVKPTATGLLFSTFLTGLGFLLFMQFTMRLAREINSDNISRIAGLLMSGYATGQLIGLLISLFSVVIWRMLNPALLMAAIGLWIDNIVTILLSAINTK